MGATPAGLAPKTDDGRGRLDAIASALLTIGIFLIAVVLLISVGGEGIVTAPLMIPLLYIRVRMRPTKPFKFVGGLLAALTAAELGWGITYRLAGNSEPKPWIWLVPLAGAVATATAFVRLKLKANA